MNIKVAIFEDDITALKGEAGLIKDVCKIEPECFITQEQIKDLMKRKAPLEADVAFIDLSFMVSGVDSQRIIEQCLAKDTRRVIVSGHYLEDVKRDVIERLRADHYLRLNMGDMVKLTGLGRVTEEEINQRGFSVCDDEGERVVVEMGIAPDAEINDDKGYMERAKRGENR